MRRRVSRRSASTPDLDPDELTVQTYHAFAASIVREHALLLGLDGDPALLDRARAWQLASRRSTAALSTGSRSAGSPSFVGKVLALNEEMQRHVVSPETVRAWCDAGPPATKSRASGWRRSRRSRPTRASSASETRSTSATRSSSRSSCCVRSPEVLDRLRARFRYVFLDEYQDTDVAQRELVRLIGAPRGARLRRRRRRPGDLRLARRDDPQHVLRSRTTSRARSTETLSDQLPLRQADPRPRERARSHPTSGPGGEVRAPLTPGARSARTRRSKASSRPPARRGGGDRRAHRGRRRAVVAIRRSSPRRAACSTRSTGRSRPRGVPVEVDTLGGFWLRPEMIDVLAWLRVLADPGDNIALARLLLGPAYRLSRTDLFFLAAAREGREPAHPPRRPRRAAVRARRRDRRRTAEIPELSEDARERIAELRADVARAAGDRGAGFPRRPRRRDRARLRTGCRARGLPDPEADVALRHLARSCATSPRGTSQ